MWRTHAAVALVASVVGLTGCGTYGWGRDAASPTPSSPAATSATVAGGTPVLPTPESAAKGALFLAEAAHGGASEMEQSRVALERATRTDVKDFARMILDDHRKSSQQLAQLAQRAGVALPTAPTVQVERKTEGLQHVKATDFDAAYLANMVADHQRAVSMYRDAARFSADPAIRAWAAAQVPILEQHLAAAQRLASTTTTAVK